MSITDPINGPFRGGKTIVVIGFPARDTKFMLDGSTAESLGGILFTAVPLAILAKRGGHRVVPVANFGVDCSGQGERTLLDAGCAIGCLRTVAAKTQHSFITFTGDNERWEKVEGRLPELPVTRLDCVREADAVVVNFITGSEMDRAAFSWLAGNVPGPIIVDYHTLALATLPDGRRVPRRRPDWAAWVQHATVVQMNEDEASALAGRRLASASDCASFARELVVLGPRGVVITRAEKGSVGAERVRMAGKVTCAVCEVPAPESPRIVDTVGCGDVFLAGLALGWLEWGSLEPAMRLAARAAAIHVQYEGLSGAERLAKAWPGGEGKEPTGRDEGS